MLLCRALTTPRVLIDRAPSEFTTLVAQARSTGLLATLAVRLEQEGLLDQLPREVCRHFRSAAVAQAKQRRDLSYEIEQLKPVFQTLQEPLTLLKGAAYLVAGMRCGAGRVLSDIDLLVPANAIDRSEEQLLEAGWRADEKDPYDDRYYRQWMHEIPPLFHPKRGSTLDVHHTILPPTATPDLDPALLLARRRELSPGVYGLCREDMVLHSAAHLFFESEFANGLRDLWDQYAMLSEFCSEDPGFWERLAGRARELDLVTALWLSLRYVEHYFSLQPPAEITARLRPPLAMLRGGFWDFVFLRVFSPHHPDSHLPLRNTAISLAYIRGHALRMPARLLIPHLTRKGVRRLQDRGLLPRGEG